MSRQILQGNKDKQTIIQCLHNQVIFTMKQSNGHRIETPGIFKPAAYTSYMEMECTSFIVHFVNLVLFTSVPNNDLLEKRQVKFTQLWHD